MLTAQEAKERTERAAQVKKNMEFNKNIALIEKRIEATISQGDFVCDASVQITNDLYTKEEKKLLNEKIIQTITDFGYKVIFEGGTTGSDNTYRYDYIIDWR